MASWQLVTVATLLTLFSICATPDGVLGQTSSTWTNPTGGIWSDASNWDTPDAPVNGSPDANSEYVAEIDLETGASYDILLSGGVEVNGILLDSEDARLRIGDAQEQISGFLDLNSIGSIDVFDGDLIISRGTIRNGFINQSGEGRILVTDSQGEIRSSTISGDVTFEDSGSFLDVIDSQINGSVDLSNGGFLDFMDTNQVFENASIQFGGGIGISRGSSLTFEETTNVSGPISISISQAASGARFINRTTLLADGNDETQRLSLQAQGSSTEIFNEGRIVGVNGARLLLNDFSFVLDTGLFVNAAGGEISLSSGSSATLGSSSSRWRNDGLIALDDSRLTLNGTYSFSDLGTITRTNGSEIVLRGIIENESQVIELNEMTGDFILNGRIDGGTVRFNGGELLFEGDSGSGLNGAHVEGTIRLSEPGTELAILNGGGFNRLEITGSDSEVVYTGLGNRLSSGESISLGSSGAIELDVISRDGELVFEEGSSISGGGRITSSLFRNASIVNQGTIDVSGRLVIDVDDRNNLDNQFTNEGVINIGDFSTLAVNDSPFVGAFDGRFVNAETGVINVGEGSLRLQEFWQNLGTINVASGGRVNIDFGNSTQSSQVLFDRLSEGAINGAEGSVVSVDANLDNSGFTFDLGEIGDLELSGGSISGGIIEQTTDARLNLTGVNQVRDLTINGGLSFDSSASFDIDDTIINGDVVIGSGGSVVARGVLQSSDGGILNMGSLRTISGAPLELRVSPGQEIRNAGSVRVSQNSNLIIEGADLIQTAGTTLIEGGEITLAENQVFDLQQGALEGFGTIHGDVFLNGQLEIGGFIPVLAGEILVNGDLEFGASALALFDILGPTQGQTAEGFDFLAVDGEFALDGSLQVNLDPFFAESLLNGDELTIATASSILGEFNNVASGGTLSTLDGLFTFDVNYGNGSNSIILSNFAVAVPEPGGSTLLLLVGFLATLKRNRRKLD